MIDSHTFAFRLCSTPSRISHAVSNRRSLEDKTVVAVKMQLVWKSGDVAKKGTVSWSLDFPTVNS